MWPGISDLWTEDLLLLKFNFDNPFRINEKQSQLI